MEKIKKTKLITDFLGFTIGGISTGVMVLAAYHFVKYGGIILYEQNKFISWLELIAAGYGVSYFVYKILKLLTKKEIDKYIE